MLLRAQAVGAEPSLRFVIVRTDTGIDEWWDGDGFTNDFSVATKYANPSDACFDMQDILKEHYGQLPRRKFLVPIELDVYGDVTEREIAQFLHKAAILSIRNEEFGNGPQETYIAPVIHWGCIKQLSDSKRTIEDLAAEWDIEEME